MKVRNCEEECWWNFWQFHASQVEFLGLRVPLSVLLWVEWIRSFKRVYTGLMCGVCAYSAHNVTHNFTKYYFGGISEIMWWYMQNIPPVTLYVKISYSASAGACQLVISYVNQFKPGMSTNLWDATVWIALIQAKCMFFQYHVSVASGMTCQLI